MSAMASHINGISIVYSTVCSGTGLFERNSSVTGEFLTQRASEADYVFIWLRHHDVNTQVIFHPGQ